MFKHLNSVTNLMMFIGLTAPFYFNADWSAGTPGYIKLVSSVLGGSVVTTVKFVLLDRVSGSRK